MHFVLTNSRHFSSSASFVSPIGSSTCWNWLFGFPEGAHNRGLPSNPTIYTASPSLDEDWLAFGVAGGGSFRLPHGLFRSTWLYGIHFSSAVTIWKLCVCVSVLPASAYPLSIATIMLPNKQSQHLPGMLLYCCRGWSHAAMSQGIQVASTSRKGFHPEPPQGTELCCVLILVS